MALDRGFYLCQEFGDRGILRSVGRPRRKNRILALERAARRFMKDEHVRTNEQGVKERLGDPVKKRAARAVVTHRNHCRDTAAVVKHDDIHGAVNHMERFAFPQMFVRPDVASAFVNDEHFMQAVGGSRVCA